MKKLFLLATMALATMPMFAAVDAFLGKWITTEEGNKETVVSLYIDANGKYCGRIVDVIDQTKKDAVCTKCPGEWKDHPLIGIEIIKDLKLDGKELKDGKILDPRRGKWFSCSIKRDGDKLLVRGSLGPFGETKTWIQE